MTDREAMKMALDCLLAFEKEDYFRWSKEDNACVVALRAALAQPEQVLCRICSGRGWFTCGASDMRMKCFDCQAEGK